MLKNKKTIFILTNITKSNHHQVKKIVSILLLFFLLVSCQKEAQKITKITAKTSEVDSLSQKDHLIVEKLSPYKEKMTKEITRVLSYAPKNLVRTDGKSQSSLGNLMADLCYNKANELFKKETGKKVDFLLSNYGGIRSGIWKGEVRVSNAFKLMPFENTLVVAELSADKVKELFDYFIEEGMAHPLSKQVQVTIKGDQYTVKINGKTIESSKTYYVATSDYLQKGGDKMNFFKNPVSLFESNFLIRDAIIEHFSSKDTLVSNLDNRVIIK